jgi:hypothetical protein
VGDDEAVEVAVSFKAPGEAEHFGLARPFALRSSERLPPIPPAALRQLQVIFDVGLVEKKMKAAVAIEKVCESLSLERAWDVRLIVTEERVKQLFSRMAADYNKKTSSAALAVNDPTPSPLTATSASVHSSASSSSASSSSSSTSSSSSSSSPCSTPSAPHSVSIQSADGDSGRKARRRSITQSSLHSLASSSLSFAAPSSSSASAFHTPSSTPLSEEETEEDDAERDALAKIGRRMQWRAETRLRDELDEVEEGADETDDEDEEDDDDIGDGTDEHEI